ncbi:putative Ubiquitinyl hydrolase 1 protein [Naja naja]|nr:putative Ubiquitinyl hydrolase 1 protein [Naja naja]
MCLWCETKACIAIMGKKRTKGKNILQMSHQMYWDCQIDDNKTDEKSDKSAEDKPSIWLCLKCGHRNLSQTSVLRELLKEAKMPDSTIILKPPDFSITEPLVVMLDPPRPLTLAMCQFLADMQETKKDLATRFKGYQQQDSQELLRYLLDGMRTEEIQRTSAAIFKALNNSDKGNEDLKKEVKEYEKKKLMHSFVDRIFGGELTSTIMCEECQTVSLVHEPFLDLSLPVLNDQNGKKNNVKKLQKKEIDSCEENTENECYMKERNEIPVTSKHLQKKEKKIAKKQAKNQRHQQKFREKVIHLTDSDVTDKTEADHDCNKQIIESNSDIRCLKPGEEESLNTCEEHCVDKNIAEKHDENADSCDQEANNEVNLDVSIKGFVPTIECVNKFDDLHLKEDKDEEDEDIISDFSKLFLEEEEPSDDTDSLQEFYGFETQTYEVVNEDPETAFRTLADRDTINIEENSILHCLNQFTHIEKLCENNKLLCEACTRNQCCGIKTNKINAKKYVYTNAKKQMLISLAPPILTLHLKRFQQAGYNLQKVNKHIMFPEVMDLAPFCSIKCKNVREGTSEVLYSLYGIVEHSGTMRSGHYTAYVKTSTTSQLSDLVNDKIQQTSESESPRRQWFHGHQLVWP